MRRRPPSRPAAPAPARPAPRPWTERIRPGHAALALAALHLVLAAAAFDPTPHIGGDNAAYLALARSLLERGTYQELWDPALQPHTQYPPGWPLILAAGRLAGIRSWLGMKGIVMAFSALAVALSYLWARRAASPGVALAAGVLVAVGPGVVEHARWELSDVPFWAFSMLALWAFARAAGRETPESEAPPGRRRLPGPTAIAAAATLAAYATRSAGLPLVVAAAGWLAWKRRWRDLAVLAAVVLPFALGWWVRGRTLGTAGYAGFLWYVDPYQPALGTVGMAGLLPRVVENAGKYATDHLPVLLIGSAGTRLAAALGVAVVALAAAGWALRMRRAGVAELYLPLYLGLVLLWPAEWAAERFLLPALPVLLVCAGEAVGEAGRRLGRAGVVGALAAGAVVLASLPAHGRLAEGAAMCRAAYSPGQPFACVGPSWRAFLELGASIRGTLPDGSAVLSRKPTLFWAVSGYPSRVYPFSAEPDSLLRAARRAGAAYVVLDDLDYVARMYLANVMISRPRAFCVVQNSGMDPPVLMGILPGAERVPDAGSEPGQTVELGFAPCGPEYRRAP